MQGNALTVLLSGKKYLLLQGPMGPFFSDVAEWLESLGRNAVNVVFNGGDRFYCRHRHYLAYYQTPKLSLIHKMGQEQQGQQLFLLPP